MTSLVSWKNYPQVLACLSACYRPASRMITPSIGGGQNPATIDIAIIHLFYVVHHIYVLRSHRQRSNASLEQIKKEFLIRAGRRTENVEYTWSFSAHIVQRFQPITTDAISPICPLSDHCAGACAWSVLITVHFILRQPLLRPRI